MECKITEKSRLRRLYFTKMHGAGNDYIYIDALGSPTSFDMTATDLPDLSRKISKRHFGVGSDGLIAILPSTNADFRMRIFNADGSEAQMCGNGSRCVGKYLYDKGFTDKNEILLETKAGNRRLTLNLSDGEVESVTVDMGKPGYLRKEIPANGNPDENMEREVVRVDGQTFLITGVGMGNPHGVVFLDPDISGFPVKSIGKELENSDLWPEKANIEFVNVLSEGNLKMRVWERGSGETLACGTGACAAFAAARLLGMVDDKVEIELPGGTLTVCVNKDDGHILMTGPAETIAEGVYFY